VGGLRSLLQATWHSADDISRIVDLGRTLRQFPLRHSIRLFNLLEIAAISQ
jgi:hypothetical protein